jgi:hypothetical protein
LPDQRHNFGLPVLNIRKNTIHGCYDSPRWILSGSRL